MSLLVPELCVGGKWRQKRYGYTVTISSLVDKDRIQFDYDGRENSWAIVSIGLFHEWFEPVEAKNG